MKYLTIILFLLFALACNDTKQMESSSKIAEDLPENLQSFAVFYEKFHEDSLFQIQHITFPLEGVPVQADSNTMVGNTFRWQKETWKMHKQFDLTTSDYEREFLPIGETILVEKIIHKNTGFGMIRRFAKLGEDWYLIYYVGMNKLNDGDSVGS